MNFTNTLILVFTNSLVLTNWLPTGNSEVRNHTNRVEYYLSEIVTTQYRSEVRVVLVTNGMPIKVTREVFSATNGMLKLVQQPMVPLPPLPDRAR